MIGVYFADCPSGGHDMLCLDYRACGPSGEPTVVNVDQEVDYKITFVAQDFESFVRKLEDDDAFPDASVRPTIDEEKNSSSQLSPIQDGTPVAMSRAHHID